MSESVVAYFALIAMGILLSCGFPVGLSLAAIGIGGYAIAAGWKPAMGLLVTNPFTTASSYALFVLPLFLLMGELALHAGMSSALYELAHKWVGRVPGGLAIATTLACAAFAAICGSTVATVATVGKIAVPEMRRYGYDDRLATGCVTAAGTLGIMIPPSALMVVYGYVTETSIGKLLIAGIFPGLLMATLYSIAILMWLRIQPKVAPVSQTRFPWKAKMAAIRKAWAFPVVVAVIFGGIYTGVMTPNEAASVSVFVLLILFLTSPGRSRRNLMGSLVTTGRTTAMIYWIIIGAFLFGALLAYGNLPSTVASFATSLPIPPLATLCVILLAYVVMGCFLESMTMVVITLPIVFPAVTTMGFDPIWFGILVILMVEIGQITPPFAIACFTIQALIPNVALGDVFRGVLPFIICDLVVVGLLIGFPQIALFLPRMMLG